MPDHESVELFFIYFCCFLAFFFLQHPYNNCIVFFLLRTMHTNTDQHTHTTTNAISLNIIFKLFVQSLPDLHLFTSTHVIFHLFSHTAQKVMVEWVEV